MIAAAPNVSCMHGLWIIALQYTIEYTLCKHSIVMKKNVPWHILAPRRGCFSNHLPLRRVRILAELFLSYGNGVSYTIKKGIFRLCSLETKNSAVPLCFRIPNPALRRVTCAIRTLLMSSASQNLLPDALSAQTCGDCSQPMAFPLWRRLSAYSFRSMHFQPVHFNDIADAPVSAIRNFLKRLHNYN